MKKVDKKPLDPARSRLLELMGGQDRWDLKSLSLALGRNHSYLYTYVHAGSPRALKYEDRLEIAKKLNVPVDALNLDSAMKTPTETQKESLSHPHNTQTDVASENQKSLRFLSGTTGFLDQPKDLPILGSVRAGTDGFFLDQGEVMGMARRPPILLGIKNAFAVYVRDDCMVPAYEPGWVVHVHPTRPYKPGDNVIIEMLDGQAFLKRLVRRTEKHVFCKQWNPAGEVKFETAKVKTIMLVVGSSIEE